MPRACDQPLPKRDPVPRACDRTLRMVYTEGRHVYRERGEWYRWLEP